MGDGRVNTPPASSRQAPRHYQPATLGLGTPGFHWVLVAFATFQNSYHYFLGISPRDYAWQFRHQLKPLSVLVVVLDAPLAHRIGPPWPIAILVMVDR